VTNHNYFSGTCVGFAWTRNTLAYADFDFLSCCSWNTYQPWLQVFGLMTITCSLRPQLSFGRCFQLVRYWSIPFVLVFSSECEMDFDKYFFVLSERSPPIEEVIQAGVVPRFVEFLMREDFPMLQVCYFILLCVVNIFLCLYVPLTLFNVVVWGCLGFDEYSFWNIWKH